MLWHLVKLFSNWKMFSERYSWISEGVRSWRSCQAVIMLKLTQSSMEVAECYIRKHFYFTDFFHAVMCKINSSALIWNLFTKFLERTLWYCFVFKLLDVKNRLGVSGNKSKLKTLILIQQFVIPEYIGFLNICILSSGCAAFLIWGQKHISLYTRSFT